MHMLENILVGFVAFLHLAFLVLEMNLWTKPIGLKIFRNDPEFAKRSATLAANQGLYNGFLTAGLIWSLWPGVIYSDSLKMFFLGCVIIAGIFGAITVNRRIFMIQGLPALAALAVVLFS